MLMFVILIVIVVIGREGLAMIELVEKGCGWWLVSTVVILLIMLVMVMIARMTLEGLAMIELVEEGSEKK